MNNHIDPENLVVTLSVLNSINVEQSKVENREHLDSIGGIQQLCASLNVTMEAGLTNEQVLQYRKIYGNNQFPETPLVPYFTLLIEALSDSTLMILMAASIVSLVVSTYQDPTLGWIDGMTILIAVFLVSNISAGNDYNKQLQFKALEASSADDERATVVRQGVIERVNPKDIVVGDILILQVGDMIPADCIMFDNQQYITSIESSLTGEPEDIKKTAQGDCFLLSSCLLTDGEECRALVIATGVNSQWGKIKANLITESSNTPLQDKLEDMTKTIGYIGMGAALATFIASVISVFTSHKGAQLTKAVIAQGFIDSFILAVVIVVVAIPEGLPLAVTISLAYSTGKMYDDHCLIRIFAACETMGNATNICSDKTGTLTENQMTVVEGWFGDIVISQEQFADSQNLVPPNIIKLIVEHASVNRTAYLISKGHDGKILDKPNVIGNKTEGALIFLINHWKYDYEDVRLEVFDEFKDRVFAFNSNKKRSTAVLHRSDGSVRIYCKGASEWILKDCTMYLSSNGTVQPMTPTKKKEIEKHIRNMADRALRTLILAHCDFKDANFLPSGWKDNPPDNQNLCCDALVGIIDPLRSDVKNAVKIAQMAGVTVRMVTGDNIHTASAIARQCGILHENGMAIEGPDMRKLTPKQLDAILPRLQVVARSSPDDKFLLVTRLNGHALPEGKDEWEAKFRGRLNHKGEQITWDNDRDDLLPGYREEWEATRPEGGHVVGVTGDGTNDAPALKAADVGLAMGITGTKVAQGASDIVICDDQFSSIVKAIMWGRAVYDNIRKFLQFQITINIVALVLVFVGSVVDYGFQPLNAVQMLWINLIMDTLAALALGTEAPSMELLSRKPYKRTSSLLSSPMWRNIIVQSIWQLAILFYLLFSGPATFSFPYGVFCSKYYLKSKSQVPSYVHWNPTVSHHISYNQSTYFHPDLATVNCETFAAVCPHKSWECFKEPNNYFTYQFMNSTSSSLSISSSTPSSSFTSIPVHVQFSTLENFESTCLNCKEEDYTHPTLIFNTFIFCCLFNEFSSRSLFEDVNFIKDLHRNPTFLAITFFCVGLQVILIIFGGKFVKTTPLSLRLWVYSLAMGASTIPIGILMRFIPIKERDSMFFHPEDFDSPPPPSIPLPSDGPEIRSQIHSPSSSNLNKNPHSASPSPSPSPSPSQMMIPSSDIEKGIELLKPNKETNNPPYIPTPPVSVTTRKKKMKDSDEDEDSDGRDDENNENENDKSETDASKSMTMPLMGHMKSSSTTGANKRYQVSSGEEGEKDNMIESIEIDQNFERPFQKQPSNPPPNIQSQGLVGGRPRVSRFAGLVGAVGGGGGGNYTLLPTTATADKD